MLYQFVLLGHFALPWPYFPSPPFSALVTRMIFLDQILDQKKLHRPSNQLFVFISSSHQLAFRQITIPHLDCHFNLARYVKLRSSALKLKLLALPCHIPFKNEFVSIILHLKTPRRPHDRPRWRRQVHLTHTARRKVLQIWRHFPQGLHQGRVRGSDRIQRPAHYAR